MGQYYKIINLDKKEYLGSWSYNCGAKLMEFSYIGNDLTRIEKEIPHPL
ncbi:MAG: hypothetical protein ACLUJM_03555 [Finegoldia sp.]